MNPPRLLEHDGFSIRPDIGFAGLIEEYGDHLLL